VSTVTDARRPARFSSDNESDRQERLERGVAALRIRGRKIPLERVLLIAGCVLLPLGVALILLGWYGAAHTTYLEEQVPYLISGGVLGLALAAIGGFFYFGYWLTKQVNETRRNYEEQASESRRQHDQLIAALSRVESQLARQPVSRRPQRGGSTSGYNGSGGLTALVATTHGTMLHRSDCEIVANRDDLRTMPADTPGFTPCRICNPLET
jgi:hypothetical protein